MKYTVLPVVFATLSLLSSAVLASPLPATDGVTSEPIHHCPAGYHYVDTIKECIRRPYHGPVNTVRGTDDSSTVESSEIFCPIASTDPRCPRPILSYPSKQLPLLTSLYLRVYSRGSKSSVK
jgi:hypothetical protein